MPEHITLRGFVGKDPESHQFDDGTVAVRFRVATTTRRFDPGTQTWQDTHTNWFSVRCFRSLAMHVLASVRCGHPVVVTGKLQLHEWASDTGPRTIAQVDAVAVGHDLSFGTANFARAAGGGRRPPAAPGTGEQRNVAVPELTEGQRLEVGTGVVIVQDGEDDVFRPLPDGDDPGLHDPGSRQADPDETGPDAPAEEDATGGAGADEDFPVASTAAYAD